MLITYRPWINGPRPWQWKMHNGRSLKAKDHGIQYDISGQLAQGEEQREAPAEVGKPGRHEEERRIRHDCGHRFCETQAS